MHHSTCTLYKSLLLLLLLLLQWFLFLRQLLYYDWISKLEGIEYSASCVMLLLVISLVLLLISHSMIVHPASVWVGLYWSLIKYYALYNRIVDLVCNCTTKVINVS